MGRTLDLIITETLGLKEMTIARLLWQIDDLKEQLAAAKKGTDGTDQPKQSDAGPTDQSQKPA